MVIVIKKGTGEAQLRALTERLSQRGISFAKVDGGEQTLLAVTGETWRLDPERLQALPYVQSVKRLSPPYHLADRARRPEGTVVRVGDVRIGAEFCLAAGPCAVESARQIDAAAQGVRASGAQLLRGGAFKPRTSPYTFQGLGEEGLALLCRAGRRYGMPVISEILSPEQIPLFEEVDVLQVGARNMQNYYLLRALGELRKPILLKRGMSATLTEFLQAAEYILAGGNEQVILCERGIRTFETGVRFSLDAAAIPVLKRATHLPVLVDPSHAAGDSRLVPALALAAAAAGADGLLIEVHDRPEEALSDGAQALTCEEFARLACRARAAAELAREDGRRV